MKENYQKPQIIKTEKIERALVFAKTENPPIGGCTTLPVGKKIEIKDGEAKLT